MQRPAHVRVDVDRRIFHRSAHAGPRGQVHHRVEGRLSRTRRRVPLEKLFQSRRIGEIKPVQVESAELFQLRPAPILQPHVVGVVEIIEPRHLAALPVQQGAHPRGDKTGGSGHQDFLRRGRHCFCLAKRLHNLATLLRRKVAAVLRDRRGSYGHGGKQLLCPTMTG